MIITTSRQHDVVLVLAVLVVSVYYPTTCHGAQYLRGRRSPTTSRFGGTSRAFLSMVQWLHTEYDGRCRTSRALDDEGSTTQIITTVICNKGQQQKKLDGTTDDSEEVQEQVTLLAVGAEPNPIPKTLEICISDTCSTVTLTENWQEDMKKATDFLHEDDSLDDDDDELDEDDDEAEFADLVELLKAEYNGNCQTQVMGFATTKVTCSQPGIGDVTLTGEEDASSSSLSGSSSTSNHPILIPKTFQVCSSGAFVHRHCVTVPFVGNWHADMKQAKDLMAETLRIQGATTGDEL